MLIFSTDKLRLLRHFQKDPVLFAYHIGDLDNFYFNDCQWGVDYFERAHIEECILVYRGGDTPTALAFGLTERFETLLEQMLPLLPTRFYAHFQSQYQPLFEQMYKATLLGTHLKMRLKEHQTPTVTDKRSQVERLSQTHLPPLLRLYAESYPGNYFNQKMLLTDKYFGYIENGQILAVSGVHVFSDEFKLAVLGNVVTAVGHRGRGLGESVMRRLIEELASEKKMVCLNVKADNQPAIKLYEKLGFETVHEYEEALFELRLG